ncbi:chromatin segregation and condensation protein Rec8/ScpA/Scc1 (kleisin family) [Dermacoccus sp. GAS27A]
MREQARIVTSKLRRGGELTFAQLVADAEHNLVVVGRFLAILELFKEAAIAFEQDEHLRQLTVRWVAAPDARILVSDEYDAEPGSGGEGASDDAAS